MSFSRKEMAATFFLLTVALVAACTGGSGNQPSSVETKKTNAERTYLVATDATYAPFEFQGPQQQIMGFEIELFEAIAREAGLTIQFLNTPWEGIFTQLLNGDRDVVVSAVTITEERKKTLAFSEPYFEARQLIAVASNSKVQNLKDLKNLKTAVQTATTGDEILQKLFGKSHLNLKRFESIPLALKELENGSVDAVVADNGVVMNYVKNNSQKFKLIEDNTAPKEYYGFALRPSDGELITKINQGLKKVKESGAYQEIYKKYF